MTTSADRLRCALVVAFQAALLTVASLPAHGQTTPPPFTRLPLPAPPSATSTTAPAPAPAALHPRPIGGPLTMRFAPSAGATPTSPRFDLDADDQDPIAVLNAIASARAISIVFVGNIEAATSVHLRGVSAAEAIEAVARSAGVLALRQNGVWTIGPATDVALSLGAGLGQIVYRCRHVNAASMVTSLQSVFDPQQMKIGIGPNFYSPTLATGGSNIAAIGDTGSTLATLGDADPNLRSHDVILSGDPATVGRALVLASQLDRPRLQVHIDMKISDVSVDALQNLGIQWNFGNYTLSETPNGTQTTPGGSTNPVVNGIKFGKFAHAPTSISATITALETNGQAKLLAEPSIALLDGERSFILIGQRELFPHLVSTYYGTPTYDVQEVRVGIYVQVSAKVGAEADDVILAIYPQVSLITDHTVINGGVYPIIDTREQQTTIRARPGETIVIGGLIRDDDIKTISRVPLLGRIPLFGELFKYRDKEKTRSELVMTLTPTIDFASEPLATTSSAVDR